MSATPSRLWSVARRRPAVVALVMLLTACAVAVVSLALAFARSATHWAGNTRAGPELSLFIKSGVGAREIDALRARLAEAPGVASVRLIPRDEAFAELGRRAGIATGDGRANPLPDVLVARFALLGDAGRLARLAQEAQAWPGVDAVRADNDGYVRLAQSGEALWRTVRSAGAGAAAAFLIAWLLALRLLTRVPTAEARTLARLGATPRFIGRPYAQLGAAAVAAGALLGLALAHGAAGWLGTQWTAAAGAFGPTSEDLSLAPATAALILAVVCTAGWLASRLLCRIGQSAAE
jgi:cell division transport system permease protein